MNVNSTWRATLGCVALLASARAFAITWDKQAERLQDVSATLLDGFPTGDPVFENGGVELKANLSFLPKVNPKVGSKSETVPSSPVHAVPTLQLNLNFLPGSFTASGQFWAGALPAGAQKIFGISATLAEYQVGAAAVLASQIGNGEFFTNIAMQYGDTSIHGAITGPDADDSFTAKTLIISAAPGYRIPALNVWASLMIAFKRTDSEFKIGSDQTDFKLTDTLDDSSWPFATQFAVGWRHPSGIQLGLGEILVPKRVMMPRAFLSYQYGFK